MNAAELVRTLVDQQMSKNSVMPGKNGPHQHQETAVRNSCHWAISCLKCYTWYKQDCYLNYACELLQRITTEHDQSGNVTYHLRDSEGKDRCNGLIGQAWVLEALLLAFETAEEDAYFKRAVQLFSAHKFSSEQGLWEITEIDGKFCGFDPTFNHQLWFALAASPLRLVLPEAERQLGQFTAKLHQNLTVLKNGLIFHPIDRSLNRKMSKRAVLVKRLKDKTLSPAHLKRRLSGDLNYQKLLYFSYGYHLFNMYAFVGLRDVLPARNMKWLKKSFQLLERDEFWKAVDGNDFSYPYNAPGFELPLVYEFFPKYVSEQRLEWVWKQQIRKSFSFETWTFDRGTPDPMCLTARIYELSKCNISTLDRLTLDSE